MTDSNNDGAPRGPLFASLDFAAQVPALRKLADKHCVTLESVDLHSDEQVRLRIGDIDTKTPVAGWISISTTGDKMLFELEAKVPRAAPAPLAQGMGYLHAGLAMLDALLSPPDEAVGAEFTEEAPTQPPVTPCPPSPHKVGDTIELWTDLRGTTGLVLTACGHVCQAHPTVGLIWASSQPGPGIGPGVSAWPVRLLALGSFEGEDLQSPLVAGLIAEVERYTAPFVVQVDAREADLQSKLDALRGVWAKSKADDMTHEELPDAHKLTPGTLRLALSDLVDWERFAREVGRLTRVLFNPLNAPAMLATIAGDQAALQGAREGRAETWDALTGLARRLDVVHDADASPAALADMIFEASQRRREQRDIDALMGRLDEVRAALDLDPDCFFGPVMDRLRQVTHIAGVAQGELGYADFDGVADTLAAALASARTTAQRYEELAQVIGCGTNTAHETALRKAEQLQRDAKAAGAEFSALAKLRTRLGMPAHATPDAIAELAIVKMEQVTKARDEFGEALRDIRNEVTPDALAFPPKIVACVRDLKTRNDRQAQTIADLLTRLEGAQAVDDVDDVVGWAKLQRPVVTFKPGEIGIPTDKMPPPVGDLGECLDALGDSAKDGKRPPAPSPEVGVGSVVQDARDMPPGSTATDRNGRTIVCWPDGSYGRPGGTRFARGLSGRRSFAPYTITRTGLSATECDAIAGLYLTERAVNARGILVGSYDALRSFRGQSVSPSNPRPVCIEGIATSVVGLTGGRTVILAQPVTAPAGAVVELIE